MFHLPTQKAHTTTWLLVVLAALVLYILSVPPMQFLTAKPHADSLKAPDWVLAYGKPYTWAQENTFLEDPLQAYSEWWWDVIY
jgi:hypothetical protein